MTTEDEWRRGRRRLKDLLPWARAELRKGGLDAEISSGLARAMVGHIREDRLEAILIYPGPKGGWHGDVVFKDMPPGVPTAMGSPVGKPLASQAAAEEMVKGLLVQVLGLAAQKMPAEDVVFHMHDSLFRFPQVMYDTALAAFPGGAGGSHGGYRSKAHAIHKLDAVMAHYFPKGWDKAVYDALPPSDRAKLATIMFFATLTGVWHYPPRVDAPPKEGVQG